MPDVLHVKAEERREGEGGTVLRAFPTDAFSRIDPFVLLDDFRIAPPHGFPEHPHRGFEAVTFMLEGEFHHQDTSGADRVIGEGGAQVVTMGNGLRHSEMPGDSPARGLQLWINLPAEDKDMEPGYQDADGVDLPVEDHGPATIRTILGPGSPLSTQSDVIYRHIETTGPFSWDVPEGWNGLLYVTSGSGAVTDDDLEVGDLLVLEGGGSVRIDTGELSFVTIHGKPLGQPIEHHGPFVD